MWAIMEYREEAAQMKLRDGALLMRGGGRKKGGAMTRGRGELIRGSGRIQKDESERGRTDGGGQTRAR